MSNRFISALRQIGPKLALQAAFMIGVLVGAGLVLEKLGEHPDPYWNAFPNIPTDQLGKLPQTLSILARRPACT